MCRQIKVYSFLVMDHSDRSLSPNKILKMRIAYMVFKETKIKNIIERIFTMRQPIINLSRVPRYQKDRRMSGLCHSSVKPSNIGEGLVRVDVSWFVL